jgi:hypothetical protein
MSEQEVDFWEGTNIYLVGTKVHDGLGEGGVGHIHSFPA